MHLRWDLCNPQLRDTQTSLIWENFLKNPKRVLYVWKPLKVKLIIFRATYQSLLLPNFSEYFRLYPPASKVSKEVANLTERKNPHTQVYGVKESVWHLFILYSVSVSHSNKPD